MKTKRWWKIVDYDQYCAYLQTGHKDCVGKLHSDEQIWAIDTRRGKELYEQYNKIQFSKCPYDI